MHVDISAVISANYVDLVNEQVGMLTVCAFVQSIITYAGRYCDQARLLVRLFDGSFLLLLRSLRFFENC